MGFCGDQGSAFIRLPGGADLLQDVDPLGTVGVLIVGAAAHARHLRLASRSISLRQFRLYGEMGGDEVGLAVHGEGGRAIPGLWFFRRFPAGQQHEESEAHGKEQAGGQGGPAEPFPLLGGVSATASRSSQISPMAR